MERHLSAPTKPVSLRNGQIVYGKIEKVETNGMAFVKIGNEMIQAELQTPLRAGNYYWFQVAKADDNIRLQIIESPQADNTEATVEQTAALLAKKWGLSREVQPLLRFLLQKQLPIVKEEVIQAAKWLLATPEKDINLRALQMMYTNRLPFTEPVFLALKAVQLPTPFTKQLADLQMSLSSLPAAQTSEAMQMLTAHLQRMTNGMVDAHKALLVLLYDWVQHGDENAYRLLQKLGIWPDESGQQPWDWLAKQIMTHRELAASLFSSESLTESNVKQQLGDWIVRMQHEIGNNREQALEQIRTLLTMLSDGKPPNELSFLYEAYQKGQLPDGVQSLLLSDENIIPEALTQHIKALVQALGLEHEAAVEKNLKSDVPFVAVGLKSLLLRAQQEIKDEALKKQVETLIHRLTGYQLLSQEQGPIQPLFMQLPLYLGNEQTDVTIHWQGRKKEDGEIDPHYCRILFYLQLKTLKEMVVDVRIQNSIVHVSLFNDTPQLETIVSLMQPMLKERLAACGYTLSTVKVATPPEQQQSDVLFLRVLNNYSEVDYRI